MSTYLSPEWHWPVVFFGVGPGDDAGHFWHAPGGRKLWSQMHHPIPQRLQSTIDGTFAPADSRASGRAVIAHLHGLTILSFWDYSADSRGGCNGNFVAPGCHDFRAMLTLAQEHFPRLMERIGLLTEVSTFGDPEREVEA